MAPIRFNPARSLPDDYRPKKVALAYSGGLVASCIIRWLAERYGCEVIAVAADVGQPRGLSGVEARALASGATRCYVLNLRHELLTDGVFPTLRAGAFHEHTYLRGTSLARPMIAKHQVEIAQRERCDALAHGCAGRPLGAIENDQPRFESTYQALAPLLRVIAPREMWDIRSREDALAYAEAHEVPATSTQAKITSIDSHLRRYSDEDLWRCRPAGARGPSVAPDAALERPAFVTITFERGTPVALDGQWLDPVDLVAALNELGGAHAIGRIDPRENRLVGMRSYGVAETPSGRLLTTAHRELEQATLDKTTLRLKDLLAHIYADVVYNGQWFSPLREALDAFVAKTQEPVTGDVQLKLDNGRCVAVGRRSSFGRYDDELATFGDVYKQADAEGLIRLFGFGQTRAAPRGRRLHGQDVGMLR